MFALVSYPLAAIISLGVFALGLVLLRTRNLDPLERRLHQLAREGSPAEPDRVKIRALAEAAVPRLMEPLLPRGRSDAQLQARLVHAGFYGPNAVAYFYATRLALLMLPWMIGVVMGWAGLTSPEQGLLVGGALSMLGILVPGLWLRQRIRKRQGRFRRVLPDLLDVLVICLEGGCSLAAGFRRVNQALRGAYPFLARELTLLEREMQLGASLSDGLRHWAERTDLEELSTLATVVAQSEKYGTGLLASLQTQASVTREQNLQRAEEKAHKASVKILFPTLLLLFPGIFVILLGPAVVQVEELMKKIRLNQNITKSGIMPGKDDRQP